MAGTVTGMRYPDAPRPDTIESGDDFEDFVADKLAEECGIVLRTYKSRSKQLGCGENKAGFEIKLDEGCIKYGHLSIEIAERAQAFGQWVPSGIFRRDNSWLYIQGNKDIFWIFFKPTLIAWYRQKSPQISEPYPTIRRFFLEFGDADRIGHRIDCSKCKATLDA